MMNRSIRIFLLTGTALSLLGCGPGRQRTAGEMKSPSADSTTVSAGRRALSVGDPSVGRVTQRIFTGVAADTAGREVHFRLTLWNQQFSGDGTYDLVAESRRGDAITSQASNGIWRTLRGTEANRDATVIQLHPGGDSLVNFQATGQLHLTFLDASPGVLMPDSFSAAREIFEAPAAGK